ncbi:MAG: beta-ketoacyl synthase N-terminal-like domain-containing protein [Flavobacteriaceae bacterium]
MGEVYASYNNIISSYGFDSETAVQNISHEVSGLRCIDDQKFLPEPFYASLIDHERLQSEFEALNPKERFTRLEKMMLVSLEKVIKASRLTLTDRVGLIISTTKGNIDVLGKDSSFQKERAYLGEMAKAIQDFFGFTAEPIVLSNACVSGILAVAVAKRFIVQERFDHVFIVSGDLVTKFILSGFNSFQALSNIPCRPYCKTRSGINIGEVAASILVTKDSRNLAKESVVVLGEASCNDANHISGPSRTGEGLFKSVQSALKQANLEADKIDYISAHGTATSFNDEMEAIAFDRLGMRHIPLNSLKGYFGHTLGASGLLETIVGMHSLHQNTLFATKGFQELGVSKPLNIIEETISKKLYTFLKTASGFGGCNTAVIFAKSKLSRGKLA